MTEKGQEPCLPSFWVSSPQLEPFLRNPTVPPVEPYLGVPKPIPMFNMSKQAMDELSTIAEVSKGTGRRFVELKDETVQEGKKKKLD